MNPCPGIVVVEDDDNIREAIREVLELEGYPVQAFANGQDAMNGLQNCGSACLILLDLMMPVMDGWEFMRHRTELGDTIAAVPVFIVSAVGDPLAARRSGARGYIKKPIDVDLLLALVRKHCGEAHRQQIAA